MFVQTKSMECFENCCSFIRDSKFSDYCYCRYFKDNIVAANDFLRKHKELTSGFMYIYYKSYKVTEIPWGYFVQLRDIKE